MAMVCAHVQHSNLNHSPLSKKLLSSQPPTPTPPATNHIFRSKLKPSWGNTSPPRKRVKGNTQMHLYGPPQPNISKIIANKDVADVASAMNISQLELETMMANKNEAVERWGPVFAKATRTCKVGLLRLLNKDYSSVNSSIGSTIGAKLAERNTSVLEMFKTTLNHGWSGWSQYKIDEPTWNNFLQGNCAEAEGAADLLLKLANATDPTNIYGIFIE